MTSLKPVVSVVVPTRNRPALLLRAVRSALEQTLLEIEIIVVIDGETGSESADALKGLHEPRIRYIALSQQAGGSEARNIGIRSARAQWIAMLDDDDEWLPTKLAAQLASALKHGGKQHLVVTCQHRHRVEGAPDVVRPRRLPRLGEPPYEFMFDYLCYFQTSTFFCSRQLMLKIPFTKNLPFFQDIDWFLRAVRDSTTQLVVVAEPLSIYYAPEKRSTVTSGLGWRARLEWGKRNRHLMGRRGYSRFIVGSCAGPAVQDRAGVRGLGRLVYECAFVGSVTPQLLLLLFGTYMLRPALRKKLRDRFLLQRLHTPFTPEHNSIG